MAKGDEQYLEASSGLSSYEASTSQSLMNIIFASLLAVVPAYFYHSVKDMPLEANIPYYAGSVVLCVYFMLQAYQKTANSAYKRIHEENHGTHQDVGIEKEKKAAARYRDEASQYSLFVNNLTFAVIFLFLAFYALRQLQVEYNFSGSVVLASILVWLLK